MPRYSMLRNVLDNGQSTLLNVMVTTKILHSEEHQMKALLIAFIDLCHHAEGIKLEQPRRGLRFSEKNKILALNGDNNNLTSTVFH